MEGKNVIMTTLLLSLVLAQIQVDAKSNCPTTTSRNCYNVCRLGGASQQTCAKLCGCTITSGNEYLGQIEVETKRICCQTTTANSCFNMCRMAPWACAERCECKYIADDEVCVVDNHDIIKNTGETEVEAKRICCQTTTANSCFNRCRMAPWACAKSCECKFIADDEVCVVDNHDILKNTGDDANEYCKLGCVSSVCGAMTTLQNSDASEVVNGAVEKCTKACSTFCTKGSIAAVEVETA